MRELEALADLAEDVLVRHAYVVEDQRRRAPLAHRRDRLGLPAHVAVDEEAGDPPASGSTTAKTIMKSASLPPVMNVFSPLITQSPLRP